MILQSSFLIRCFLVASPDGARVRNYEAEHVQTGARHHSTDLNEISRWLGEVNNRFIHQTIENEEEAL